MQRGFGKELRYEKRRIQNVHGALAEYASTRVFRGFDRNAARRSSGDLYRHSSKYVERHRRHGLRFIRRFDAEFLARAHAHPFVFRPSAVVSFRRKRRTQYARTAGRHRRLRLCRTHHENDEKRHARRYPPGLYDARPRKTARDQLDFNGLEHINRETLALLTP